MAEVVILPGYILEMSGLHFGRHILYSLREREREREIVVVPRRLSWEILFIALKLYKDFFLKTLSVIHSVTILPLNVLQSEFLTVLLKTSYLKIIIHEVK